MDPLTTEINTDTFEIDDGTVNYGNDYQEKCVALFTLKLLNESTVEKFWLTSNMKLMSPFDDLFICTIENGRKTIYLVQIKHNRKQKSLRDDDFVKKNSKLHLKKISAYQKLLDENSHRYPKEFQPADHVSIIVFTNRPVDPLTNTALQRVDSTTNNNNHFLSTSQEIYTAKTEVVLEQKLDIDFTSKFLVYASQLDLDDPNNIPEKFQKYISNWLKIEAKKFALTKPRALRLYHFATLHQQLQWPRVGPCEEPWAEHIWTHLKNNFGVATVDFIEAMIQHDWKELIQDEYSDFFSRILFGTTVDCLQIDQLVELKGVVGVNPLIVVIDEGVDVEAAGGVFTIVGVKGNEVDGKFEKLRDVGVELETTILNTEISLQGRQKVALGDLLGGKDISEFTITSLLDVCKSGNIGRKIVIDEECHIARKLYKIFVRGNTIKNNASDVFVIKTNMTRTDFEIIYNKSPEEVTDIHPTNKQHKYILVNEYDDVNLDQLVTKNVHFLGKTDLKDAYEWNGSCGSAASINPIKFNNGKPLLFQEFPSTFNPIEEHQIELRKISTYSNSILLVISGVPGIGKTMCTKEIACNISSNRWVLLVNLKDEVVYFNELLRCKTITAEQHLQHFFKENHCEISSFIFARKLRGKNVTIILDGFDEIAPRFTKVVAGMIKTIRDAGFKMIVTTRTVLQKRIEQEFNTVSLSLVPFDKNDINSYVRAYVKLEDGNFRNGLIKHICERMLTFCIIPLHLKLVVDIAVEEFENNIDTVISDVKINQLQLYKKYIEMKLALFSSKIGLINFDEQEIGKYHKYFAVKTLFQNQPEYECIEARMDVKLEDYEEKLGNGSEKTGLLVADYKEGVFIHRTIAEYYAALWLLDHTNKSDVEIRAAMLLLQLVMVKPEYTFVRMFMEQQCASSDFNREEFVNFVLEHEVNFNKYLTKTGGNALHVVAERNQGNLAGILIACGCAMDKKNNSDETALHCAARSGNRCVVKLLISEGADVNCRDFEGNTALLYVVMSTSIEFDLANSATNINSVVIDNINIIKALLTNGADINSTTSDGKTVIAYLASHHYSRFIKHIMLLKLPVSIANIHHYRELFLIEAIKLILEKNPNCNIPNKTGDTVVHIAASNFTPIILKMILAVGGCDVNVRNKGGLTPLHTACDSVLYLNVSLLVTNNADVNVCDNEGTSPLHLLMKRSLIHRSNSLKYWKKYLKCIHALLDNGADRNMKNNNGWSPNDLAKDNSIEHVFDCKNKDIDYDDDDNDDDDYEIAFTNHQNLALL